MEWLTYDVLRVIWWALLGILLIGFAVLGGYDLGVGILLPFVARTDSERRVLINSIGPTWEGNQVWLILGGGAVFAAFPALYAAAFSGFYLAMLLILLALILRPVGFDFRNKLTDARWRATWDVALLIGGFVPALLSGVAIGNLFLGVPFHYDADLRFYYDGNFFLLLRPFALLCGLVSVAMLVTQGAAFLNLKTTGRVQQRAQALLPFSAGVTIALFAIGGLIVATHLDGFVLANLPNTAHGGITISTNLPSNPLFKSVGLAHGGWLANYSRMPWFMLAPALAFIALLASALLHRRSGLAFIASSIAVACIILTAGFSLFPFLFPSNSHPSQSLTVWDATSSELTLRIMLIAVLIFMPIVLAYTSWVFRVLRGRVDEKYVSENSHSLY